MLLPVGHGLCSSVYKAPMHGARIMEREGGVPNFVCIKQVDVDVQSAPHNVQREVALLQRTRHMNLALLLAVFTDSPDHFTTIYNVVMPLYPIHLPDILNSTCARPSSLSMAELAEQDEPWLHVLGFQTYSSFVLSSLRQLVEAVAHLHHEQIAHRDLKPSNIMFGIDGTLKLIDLGVAWEVGMHETPPFGRRPSEGSTDCAIISDVGSGAFRAPELLFAPKNGYNAFQADMWSLGTVLAGFFTSLDEEPVQSLGADFLPWERELFPDRPTHPELSRLRPRAYHRATLFDSSSGDITLACDIFKVLGLPRDESDWPEAAHFQPPLHDFPFMHGPAKESLLDRLPTWAQLSEVDTSQASQFLKTFLPYWLPRLLELSAARRPSIDDLLEHLRHPIP